MKKALAAAFALAFSLAGCGGGASSAASPSSAASAGSGAASASASQTETGGEPVELTVFAAASLTETLNRIAEDYKVVAPNVTLTFNFDSSGTLKTQIQEGAVCDVFLSAGQKQMDQLDKTADASVNTEGLDFVAEGTRVNLLENKVALCVAEGSDASIASFDDLAKALEGTDILMAMGNSDVPVGQYTQQILAYYNLDEEALANAGKITYGSNVKEVTTQITEGSVDCGVVYCTDAFSAGITPVDYATEEMCGQVIYPAAVLNVSQHSEEAQAFLDYLQTDAAMQVFEEVGFSPVK
ncbi:molybdate ABC transporter substrate-binding protein [Gemmiger sp. An50]|uniref:molybdate ABC transporter substrate-binding protein n=1 Tax=Gemmiger sp. An50 TaxID=1965639 RepID=UPI000B379334|nr:molybdate ABC transporter substrate-binding protein [Gemmiger sp. An50]OUN86927.1 molybdate ABC transporter substrate-binding protein [Gemmiger sp. An50]